MSFLKSHGKFIGIALALLGLVWYANGEVTDLDSSLQRQRQTAKNLLGRTLKRLFADAKENKGVPATIANRRIQGETQVLQQTSRERNRRISFETAPIYTLASLGDEAGDRAISYYRERDLALRSKFQHLRYITIPNVHDPRALGFQEPKTDSGMTQKQVEDLLRKMDIVETTAESAGRANVQRLEGFEFVAGVSDAMHERQIPTKLLSGDRTPYISGDALRISIYATEEALYNFLIELQKPNKGGRPNRYLAVWEFELEKPDLLDPSDNLIHASITVVALRFNESSSYPVEQSNQPTDTGNRFGGRNHRFR